MFAPGTWRVTTSRDRFNQRAQPSITTLSADAMIASACAAMRSASGFITIRTSHGQPRALTISLMIVLSRPLLETG